MSALREEVLLQMRLRGFAAPTVESYVHALEELARFFWRQLDALTCAQVQKFLEHLIRVRKSVRKLISAPSRRLTPSHRFTP